MAIGGKKQSSFAPKQTGMGGPKPFNSGKVTKISAPAKPKMASMSGAHGKLVKGDA